MGASIIGIEALEIIVDATQGIGECFYLACCRGMTGQQSITNVARALGKHAGCPRKRYHRQSSLNGCQHLRHILQQSAIPLRGHRINNRVFYLLETTAGLLHNCQLGFAKSPGCFGVGRNGVRRLVKLRIDPHQTARNIEQ